MPYFKDQNNTIHFLDDANFSHLLPADCVEISEEEAESLQLKPVLLTSKELRAVKLAEFKAKSDLITFSVREEYPTDEVLSWSKQEVEARAYLADNSAPTPLLSAIAENRSIPLALLAEKVAEKADVYAIFTGQIFGIRQALEDRLLAVDLDAPDAIEQINAIMWPEG